MDKSLGIIDRILGQAEGFAGALIRVHELEHIRAVIVRAQSSLKVIAGEALCADMTMGNVEIAKAALAAASEVGDVKRG